ncbi:putative NTP pyrophosphohydrolase, NUDIX family [Promicromonospora umidemergens]|uniref:NUDIX domain-containing protein n=1 Tax=Promicromonospora umidemergens TaxID=629679 RepID=A0ABP8X728_9MICO|nr:NUDIX domain-containing protein [Promicromonospora umidemergens]MCP2281452.1 putative NTP pyrophosphohydrolase, NUDIX family [Promicromonospora umidemergens]
MPTTSAGLLPYRQLPDGGLEVLLGHMGGPFWARKDAGAWTVLKGELAPGEDPHAAALREASEELGIQLPPSSAPDLELGEVRQRAGKRVLAWARKWPRTGPDLSQIASNTLEIEWPPRSGQRVEIPEIDRVAWLSPDEARRLAVSAQAALIDRLEAALANPAA